MLSSDNPDIDIVALGDYATRNVLPEIQRLPGIGQGPVIRYQTSHAHLIDPAKLAGFNLSAADVNNAIRAQNAQVSSGRLASCNITGQSISATVVVDGLLNNTAQFGNILLRANADGSAVR